MILNPGETAVGSESISWAVGPGGGQTSGVLYLTSHRLVFEGMVAEPGAGLVPKTLLDLPLSWITNALVYRPDRRSVLLRVENGPHNAYTFGTVNAERWVHSILGWRARLPPASAAAPRPGSTSAGVTVQVQQLPSQPLVLLHCRHCGTLNDAGSRACKSCGASL